MDRYARGDSAAFGTAYDLVAPRLYSFLLRRTRNRSAAEDLVQQTYDGLSLAQAAEALGTTVMAVKLRAHRAYEALRACLGDADVE